MLNILAVNPGHNGACALISDGKLVFYGEEERFSRSKYDGNPFRAMLHVLTNFPVHVLVLCGTSPDFSPLPWTSENAYQALVRKFNPQVKTVNMGHLHHLGHAASAFYGSGFDTAVAVVVDGAGSYVQENIDPNQTNTVTGGFETESIYYCSYPGQFDAMYKRYSDGRSPYYDNGIQEFDSSVTITKAYEAVTQYLGFGFIEAGKTMGLAPYGKEDENIPPFFVENKGNRNLLQPLYPSGAVLDENRYPYLRQFCNPRDWHQDFSYCPDIAKNVAYRVQQETQEQVCRLIQKAIDMTGEKNVVLSGGYALNCVANYYYRQRFPDINFYVDPVAHDGGTTIGMGLFVHYDMTNSTEKFKLETLYLSAPVDYNLLAYIESNVKEVTVEDITLPEVAADIADGKVIALFQGRAEGGPRALGNRSILFNPTIPDGKDIVNAIKHREWFRPFAGTVLAEEAGNYFEMLNINESPYMMYAVKVRSDNLLPSITHVDGTCRVQTVTKEQNPVFYDLITEFKKITGVPVLFNTSFNLAGDPLVETVFDAVDSLLRSDIDYVYLADIGKVIRKSSSPVVK
jgi:carbamoyltransferase